MKITLPFMLLLTSLNALSFEVKREGDKLILNSSTCEEAKELAASLLTWSQTINKNQTCTLSNADNMSSGPCRLDITKCVPDHVAKYSGLNPQLGGPNCWNLALMMSKIIPNLRYSTPEEMSFFMKSPLCRQLKEDEKVMPGDIGAVRNPSSTVPSEFEIHGFIYASDKIVYSKAGARPWDVPFGLLPLESMQDTYNKYSIVNFRCDSMKNYLEAHKDVPTSLLKVFKSLDTVDNCFEGLSLNSTPLPQSLKGNIKDIASVLTHYLEDESGRIKKEEERFLLGSLQVRLQAMAEDLKIVAIDKKLVPDLEGLSQTLERYSRELAR
jgi:hypothetical protein